MLHLRSKLESKCDGTSATEAQLKNTMSASSVSQTEKTRQCQAVFPLYTLSLWFLPSSLVFGLYYVDFILYHIGTMANDEDAKYCSQQFLWLFNQLEFKNTKTSIQTLAETTTACFLTYLHNSMLYY